MVAGHHDERVAVGGGVVAGHRHGLVELAHRLQRSDAVVAVRELVDGLLLAAHHQAEPPVDAEDTTACPAVDVVDFFLREHPGALAWLETLREQIQERRRKRHEGR